MIQSICSLINFKWFNVVSVVDNLNDNGDVTVDIVEKFVVGELSNPSSKISKSMKQNFNITDRR